MYRPRYQYSLNVKRKKVRATRPPQRKLNDRQKKQVKKIISVRQELKFFDYNLYGVAADTIPLPISVTNIPQGNTDITRNGDRIMWCGSIQMILQLNSNYGTNVPPVDTWRFIVFQWHPSSTPTAANILLTGPSGTQDVYSQYSHDFRQQFTILCDIFTSTIGQSYYVAAPGYISPTTSLTSRQWFKVISLRRARKQVQYAAADGTTGTNKIYIMYMTDTAAGAATKPFLNLSMKTVFRDS